MYPFGMYSMMYNTTMMPGNVHENLKARYGVGHADFGKGPTYFNYPMEILPAEPKSPIQKSWLARIFRKLYC